MAKHYKDSLEFLLAYAELIGTAQRRGLITYGELASLLGLPTSGNYMGRELGNYLAEVSRNEQVQGRPMLSAVVVYGDGSIGNGFFELAQEMGLLETDDVSKQGQFWETQNKAVYDTWKRGGKRKA
jgi:hypothetical protein